MSECECAAVPSCWLHGLDWNHQGADVSAIQRLNLQSTIFLIGLYMLSGIASPTDASFFLINQWQLIFLILRS